MHRVENCGVHYSLTIEKWYENWQRNEEEIVAKYGERWFRMWTFFLAWSALIAAQGSSTVFMITLTKNVQNDKDSVSEGRSPTRAFQPHAALGRQEAGRHPTVGSILRTCRRANRPKSHTQARVAELADALDLGCKTNGWMRRFF